MFLINTYVIFSLLCVKKRKKRCKGTNNFLHANNIQCFLRQFFGFIRRRKNPQCALTDGNMP